MQREKPHKTTFNRDRGIDSFDEVSEILIFFTILVNDQFAIHPGTRDQ